MNILQTIFHGALGALTFGIYYHITTMRQIEINNKKIEMKKIEYENHYLEVSKRHNARTDN